ncbi:D-arabinono-1,4-lactone oxidase [Aquimarina agarilytica]|uniref:D-arabinono-1,4-lactone oxidase n=1 Tax=Aquimarina agarilytica TaxID=1087449 RepID=UPI00028A25CA|nr:D-arabinono-1,4-lactone oxidase [Aquimarina agarilytica]
MNKGLKWINWSHSFISHPDQIVYPATEQELVQLTKTAKDTNQKIKVVGSGHSCSLIAATKSGYLIDLKNYNKVIHFDATNKLLTVQSGTSLEKIANFALRNKLALDNLGTIVEQSISGAISTGTHGSGLKHDAIDQSIVAFTLITANGHLKIFDKRLNLSEFNLAVVSLGALGIISSVTIQLVADYHLKINTTTLNFKEMIEKLDLAYTDEYMRFWWAPHTDKVQYWKASKTQHNVDTKSNFTWFNDIFKGNILHEVGLWLTSFNFKNIPRLNKIMYKLLLEPETKDKVVNFLDGFTLPILVKQKVMEYGIPIEETKAVLLKINTLLEEKNHRVHMPIEIRFAPKDDAALSMAHGTPTCYIGIIAYKPYGKVIDFGTYFKDVHDIFAAHQGRPHWAKVTFYSKEQLAALYPKWKEFNKLKQQLDPKEMFTNDFLKRLFD